MEKKTGFEHASGASEKFVELTPSRTSENASKNLQKSSKCEKTKLSISEIGEPISVQTLGNF